MFEISHLRCFVAVAEELHFNRAAERLNMTQPPLSRQIKLLEHHVGTLLLDRTSRTVKLTAAGRSFFPEAARILRMADEAAATARRVAKGDVGSLAIGFTAATGYSLLPEIVRLVRNLIPGVSLTLKEMVSNRQLDALDAGELDFALLRPHAVHTELDTIELLREGLVLAIPEAEASSWREQPLPTDLHNKPFLQYSPFEARYFHNMVERIFDRAGVAPDVIEYVAQIHTMLALVQSGMGVALIPEAATRLHFEGTVLRPMAIDPPKPVVTVCSYRKNNDNPMLTTFRSAILEKFPRLNP